MKLRREDEVEDEDVVLLIRFIGLP